MIEKGSSFDDDYDLSMDDVTHQLDVWVLDYRASYHICSNKELFSSYCQTDGGAIHMTDGTVCKGFSFKGERGDICVYKSLKVLLKRIKDKTLYVLQGLAITGLVGVVLAEIQEADQTRLWHMSERGMQELHKKGYLVEHTPKILGFCEHCVIGKLQHSKFPKAVHRTKDTLDYIHSDCWSPSRVE
ncbi:hypothetical protein AXG93_1513s1180 [Marchantia polymorpha subsp. ruderalis]|uniref:Retrovirus-related Pol polyprotein from transposon TNT 1-94-like beta-barrel domain-containing protein n=1 Tax=Marchantia polymorpha subsp. ruderalis TaxID=1480154 RepID=A0A176WBN1_MARPO|nr:hypothetical protein AXG93_1513s1180 [Marchantia polymorpha subsp. ruderalis]